MHAYLVRLPRGKMVLWCYLIWYLGIVIRYFDPAPAIWVNSLGISVIIGFALLLSVGGPTTGAAGRWQTFRLFLMPFCVSSFSSLIKGRGFFLIFPPSRLELLVLMGACVAFVLTIAAVKQLSRTGRA